jgi:hypothetical protein
MSAGRLVRWRPGCGSWPFHPAERLDAEAAQREIDAGRADGLVAVQMLQSAEVETAPGRYELHYPPAVLGVLDACAAYLLAEELAVPYVEPAPEEKQAPEEKELSAPKNRQIAHAPKSKGDAG